MKYEDSQLIIDRSTMVIGQHSKKISDLFNKHKEYTSLKTIPTAIFSKSKNVKQSF